MVLEYLNFGTRGVGNVTVMLHDDGTVTWATYDGYTIENGVVVPDVNSTSAT